MIEGFRGKVTEAVFNGECPKGFPPDLAKVARRKLKMIEAAVILDDLRVPPGNKLHKLKGDRLGQYAIWINDQYRICFYWLEGKAQTVEIVDYHE